MFKEYGDLGPEAYPERERTPVQRHRRRKYEDELVEWWNSQAEVIRGFTDRMLEAGSLPGIFEKAQAGETWLTIVRKNYQRAVESIELWPSDGIPKYGHDAYWRWFRGDERLPLGRLKPHQQEIACHPTRLSKNTMEVTATNAVSQLWRESQEGTYGDIWGAGVSEASKPFSAH